MGCLAGCRRRRCSRPGSWTAGPGMGQRWKRQSRRSQGNGSRSGPRTVAHSHRPAWGSRGAETSNHDDTVHPNASTGDLTSVRPSVAVLVDRSVSRAFSSLDAIRRSGIAVGERAQLRRLSRTRAPDQPVGERGSPVMHHRYPTGVLPYQTKTFAIVGGQGPMRGRADGWFSPRQTAVSARSRLCCDCT